MNSIIYGIRPVIEAIREGKQIDKILLQTNLTGENIRQLKDELRVSNQNVKLQYVPVEKLNSVSKCANHQGVVAYCSPVEYSDLETIVMQIFEQGKCPFILFLDHLTDVRNVGAIARTAECAGVDCIILPHEGTAQINSDAIKTSAGAILRIPVCKSFNTKTTLNFLRQSGIKIYSASEKANKIYTGVNMQEPLCIIAGAEDKGVSKDALKMSDELLKIPMQGEIESLNVSVATGILIYEVIRQRTLN
ncbi:MAG: 23S rRNA (guanosine(2251)-2'-O)-methyltransferase RlmB [Bacteroidales bacterium]|nr:23S rRNA (guanosine(2251)-2'-O)-methyltransferase RlmB [Bacteroidales bacterium]